MPLYMTTIVFLNIYTQKFQKKLGYELNSFSSNGFHVHFKRLLKGDNQSTHKLDHSNTPLAYGECRTFQSQKPSSKLGSHGFVHFNVGWPRMFDVRSWCSTRSPNVSTRSTNPKTQYTKTSYLPRHKSRIANGDIFIGVSFLCVSHDSLPEHFTRNVGCFGTFNTSKSFLHLHTRGYFMKNIRRSTCASGVELPSSLPKKSVGNRLQQAYLGWNYSNCLTRLCKDDDNAMQAPWDVWTSIDTLCLAQWRWSRCVAWPTPGCDPSKLAILGRRHPVFQLLPLEGCHWCWSSATYLADAHSPWWGVLSRLQLLRHHIEKAVMIRRTLHLSKSMTIVRKSTSLC